MDRVECMYCGASQTHRVCDVCFLLSDESVAEHLRTDLFEITRQYKVEVRREGEFIEALASYVEGYIEGREKPKSPKESSPTNSDGRSETAA